MIEREATGPRNWHNSSFAFCCFFMLCYDSALSLWSSLDAWKTPRHNKGHQCFLHLCFLHMSLQLGIIHCAICVVILSNWEQLHPSNVLTCYYQKGLILLFTETQQGTPCQGAHPHGKTPHSLAISAKVSAWTSSFGAAVWDFIGTYDLFTKNGWLHYALTQKQKW